MVQVVKILDGIMRLFEEMRRDQKEILVLLKENRMKEVQPLTIDLPDHLRKTYDVIKANGAMTAWDVRKFTKRARAIESGYLNQLEDRGILRTFKVGHFKYFTTDPADEEKVKSHLKIDFKGAQD